MVRYRVLRRKDVTEVQAVALKAWTFAYRRYGLSLKLIHKFVSERYSTDSFEKTVLPSIQKGEAQFYLATNKGKIIGYSNTGPGVRGWELYRIYLLPEYIGKGVGKKLLLLCEDFLREKKARKYHAYVWGKNKAALDFYKRNGFAKLEGKNKNRVEICIEKKLTNPARAKDR
jgi:ribosomal protein S18 acetylase RimI-like enzyme